MGKVILQGHIIVPGEDIEQVIKALPDHITLTRAEAGCLVFRVEQDSTDPHRFEVYEEFADPAAFTRHQDRVATSPWGTRTKDVTRHYQVTER